MSREWVTERAEGLRNLAPGSTWEKNAWKTTEKHKNVFRKRFRWKEQRWGNENKKKGLDTEVSEKKKSRWLNTGGWYEHKLEIKSPMCKREFYQDTKGSEEECNK